MADRKKIALCLEWSLRNRGGVSVLVETLAAGLREYFDIVLVSGDTSAELAGHPILEMVSRHLYWNRRQITPQSARQLADELVAANVQLAHFHLGGVFGWGNRLPGRCPALYLPRHGIAACSTVHLVVDPLNGFCGPEKPLWFKLALFPVAWTAKLSVLRRLSCEIAVSRHDFEKLRRWYRPQQKKFRQLYHSRLRADSRPASGAPREPVVLNVGHIAVRKGQLDLVEAFLPLAAKYPDWKLLLAGDFNEKPLVEKIRALAAANNLTERIQLLGPREDALELVQRAGIYVQPSHFEALGLALQEAMFYGCPSIGARVGGIPELIDHDKTGLLVEPKTPAELSRAIELLIANPALRERFGRAGAEAIAQKGMTEEQMIANHVKLYDSILQRA